jgi:DNA repair photolyase
VIALSGNTDCYQPLEAGYRLTRGVLEVCREFRNPVGVITKGLLVRRDVDLLAELAEIANVRVSVSVPFADERMAREIEPYVPTPAARIETIRILVDAGIPTGVAVAPIIPGLNDDQVAEVLAQAREAGARYAFNILLRLPAEVKDVFLPRLARAFPHRAKKVENAIREMREGRLNIPRFGDRMTGTGPRWAAVHDLFENTCRRLGLSYSEDYGPEDEPTTFRRPGAQMRLW